MVLWRVALGLVLLAGAYLTWDFSRKALIKRWARDITIGMSKTEVEDRLGEPDFHFERGPGLLPFIVEGEEWAYLTRPLLTRLMTNDGLTIRPFGATDTDMAIVFGEAGRVLRVTIPP
jgi:hypothetical protein